MTVFIYNLIDYLSDDFKRWVKEPIDAGFNLFEESELSDFDFKDDLLKAMEKQTGIRASILEKNYCNELTVIAKQIASEVEFTGFYSGFFKKLLAPTFKYKLREILPAGDELTTEIGDVFNLETYRFTIDFLRLPEWSQKEYFNSHSTLTPQGLLDFLGYNFKRFENAIYRAIYETQGYEYFDLIEAKKELKYQLKNQLPLKNSTLKEVVYDKGSL